VYKSVLSARPLTVWEVELYAFVREQQLRNEEHKLDGAAPTETDSDEGSADTDSSTGSGSSREERRRVISQNGERDTVPPVEAKQASFSQIRKYSQASDSDIDSNPSRGRSSSKDNEKGKFCAKEKERAKDDKVLNMLESFLGGNSLNPKSNNTAVLHSNNSRPSGKTPVSWDNISLPSSIDDDEVKSETE
jgi:hypothetical protein